MVAKPGVYSGTGTTEHYGAQHAFQVQINWRPPELSCTVWPGNGIKIFFYYYCNLNYCRGRKYYMNCFLVILHCDFLTVTSVIQKDIKWCFEIFFYASFVYFDWKLPRAWIVLWSTALPYFKSDSCVFTKCHYHGRSDTVFVYNIYTSLCTKALHVISFNKQVVLLLLRYSCDLSI